MDEIRFFESPTIPGQSAPAAPQGDTMGKDTFLRLLTTQMQNQDPTSPMKNEDFVAQLAQFSSLEQLMGLQATMEGVYMGVMSMNNASMATLVGTDVVAIGDQVRYAGDPVDLHFEATGPVNGAKVVIKDESGKVVNTIDVPSQPAGEFTVAWDGTDSSGRQVEEGLYRFEITGTDGDPVPAEARVVGTVTEMDFTTGIPQPSIDGVSVGIQAILKLRAGES